jgi:tetratricopeptide (TPR) repeat protein
MVGLTYMTYHFLTMGDYDRAIQYGQHAVVGAEALGHFAPQVMPHYYLARAYHALGAYGHAIDSLMRNVTSLGGESLDERFGQSGPASVVSRSYLVWSLAEVGEFAQGIAMGEEGVRLAEAVDHPYGRSAAYFAIGLLYLRKGDLQKAIPLFSRGRKLRLSENASANASMKMRKV